MTTAVTAHHRPARRSKLSADEWLPMFSVGTGLRERNVSINVVDPIEMARERGAPTFGFVGAPGGTLGELADVAILINTPSDARTTVVDSYEAVVWHGLVAHPKLAVRPGHWESLAAGERQ